MSKNKSPLQESLLLFRHGDFIGESRQLAKEDGTADRKIFHSTTFKEYVENFSRVLKFAREEFNIHHVKELTPAVVSSFMKSLNNRGLADSTIQKYSAVVSKADAIAKYIGWRNNDADSLVREEPKGPRLKASPRPFTLQEIEQIKSELANMRDSRFLDMTQLQDGGGLRVEEAAMIRVEAISPDGTQLWLTKDDGTKKGRTRNVLITDSKTQQVLVRCREVAMKSGRKRLFINTVKQSKSLIREYQKAVQLACKKHHIQHTKTHDFRRKFAVDRLDYYLKFGLSRKEALARLSEDLGHGRSRMERGLLASYIPNDEEEDEK